MLQVLLVIAVIAPLIVYLRAGFIKAPTFIDDPHKFYTLPQMITPVEFANTSTAYGFQIASVSVFLAWGSQVLITIPRKTTHLLSIGSM